jgi:hypothetical protein
MFPVLAASGDGANFVSVFTTIYGPAIVLNASLDICYESALILFVVSILIYKC